MRFPPFEWSSGNDFYAACIVVDFPSKTSRFESPESGGIRTSFCHGRSPLHERCSTLGNLFWPSGLKKERVRLCTGFIADSLEGSGDLAASRVRSVRRSFPGRANLVRAAGGTVPCHNRRACADIPAVRMPAPAAIAKLRWVAPWLVQCGPNCAGAN